MISRSFALATVSSKRAAEAEQPLVAFDGADLGNEMPAPEAWMATLVGVERRTAEIAGQIFVEFLFAAFERRRMHRTDMRCLRQRVHQRVEAARQHPHGLVAADCLIKRDDFFRSQPSPSKSIP